MTMTDSVYVPKNPLGELIIKLGFLYLLVWARCKQKMDRASFTYAFKPSFWWGCYSLSPENTSAKLVFFEGWTRRQGQLYPETKPIILPRSIARELDLITELICICATNALTLEDCLRCRLQQRRLLLQPVCLATDIGRASALNVKNVRIKWSALCILHTGRNIKNLWGNEMSVEKLCKIVSTSRFEEEIHIAAL
jgi:hypothetical protein